MRTTSIKSYRPENSKLGMAVLLTLLFFGLCVQDARAGMRTPPPEKINAIIIGDRVVDIAYNLGVLPKAMSVRGAMWPMAKTLKTGSQILGCPNYTTVKKKETIPEALKKHGIKRVIAEKSASFCLYKPNVAPANIAAILKDKGMDVTVEYVDFTNGLESAVRQTAKLVGREDRVDELLKQYNHKMTRAQKQLPKEPLGKKVIIFNGIYQKDTGKPTLRVEAPGLYSDRFFLEPMGCTNVGDAFKPADGVMTGNAYAVQKILADYLKTHPALATVPAIKNMAVYHLPIYVDSSLLEFPEILAQWAVALGN